MPTYLALNGPGRSGPAKAPRAKGWASEDHPGVDPATHDGWLGLRCDGLVVVDCDTEEAASRWRSLGDPTHEVKTPRGHHFYYAWSPGSPTGPAVAVMDGVDIRAGRKSQVVVPPTPGYESMDALEPVPFRPAWLATDEPAIAVELGGGEDDWDVIPDGRRNDTLAAIAGGFRRQGMSATLIFACLLEMNDNICVPPLPYDEVRTIALSAGRYTPQPDWSTELDLGEQLAGRSIAEVLLDLRTMTLPPPAEWFWKPYLPKGRLVLMDGAEGIGKGLMCARLATTLMKLGCTILWGSTEDDPEEDIQRRLLAAGYDRAGEGTVLFFTVDPKLPKDLADLERIIEETGASMLILDPGRSFLAAPDNVKSFSYNDEAAVRPGLEALNRMAKRTGCTVLFVHHWNKNRDTTVQYRSGGTGAFAQVVRHRITLAWVGPTDGGEGAFEVSKSNIGPKGHVHSYSVDPSVEFDTAALALGEPEPEYPDLGAWLKAKEDEAKGVELDITGEVTEEIRSLPAGSVIPSRQELMMRGVKKNTAEELRTEWEAQGLARRGGHAGKQLIRTDEFERKGPA